MSMTMDDSIKRWTAKLKTALVIELIQGRTTVAEASRSFDLTPSEIEGWQVRKRAIGIRPRIQAVPSVATAPNERWSTDLARVWTGKDGWPPPTFAPSRHGKLARCAGQPRRAGCRPPHRGAGEVMPNASPFAPSSGLSRAGCRRDRSRFLPS